MIDWIEALKTIKCDFKSEYQGGTGEYEDLNYGKQEFLWDANKSKISITWFDTDPICTCEHGELSPECDCEWNWFLESEPIVKFFTKSQYKWDRCQTM